MHNVILDSGEACNALVSAAYWLKRIVPEFQIKFTCVYMQTHAHNEKKLYNIIKSKKILFQMPKASKLHRFLIGKFKKVIFLFKKEIFFNYLNITTSNFASIPHSSLT